MNKLLKPLISSLSAAALIMASCVPFFSVSAAAEAQPNVPASVKTEITELQSIRSKALLEYDRFAKTKCNVTSDIPADFRILFIETRNVKTYLGNAVHSTAEDERIFSHVPEQFEQIIEYLSDYNINIITETLYVDEQIQATSDYVLSENIKPWIDERVPLGSYDSVIVFTSEDPNQINKNPKKSDFGCPNSSIATRDQAVGYSYSWCPISLLDYNAKISENDKHLYSTDLAIHEWLHTLEAFRDIDDKKILMPSADIANIDSVPVVSNNSKYTNGAYEWDNVWPTDTLNGRSITFYKGVDPRSIAYTRAFLNGCLYDKKNCRYVGMFPSFWKFFSGKTYLGEFYAQNSSEKYEAYLDKDTTVLKKTDSVNNNHDGYVWRLCYSYRDNKVHIVSKRFPNWNFPLSNTALAGDKFTKISFDDADTYYIYNKGTKKYLSYNSSTKKQGFVSDFNADNSIRWNIKYAGNNFYYISPVNNSGLVWDVQNCYDIEGNTVSLYAQTGYDNAQTYQFRLNSDDTYSIYAQLTTSRCVKANGNSLVIASNISDSQKWVITKANGSKEIFPGNYTIKNSSGRYINAGSSNKITLSTNASGATKWNFKKYPGSIGADNFYLIKAANGRVLDLYNATPSEGNSVNTHTCETGYPAGQAWQLKISVGSDGEYIANIIPYSSLTRGIYTDSSSAKVSTNMTAFTLKRV